MQPDMQLLGAQFFHRTRLPERRLRQPLETDYIGIKVVVRVKTERLLPGERLGDAFHPLQKVGKSAPQRLMKQVIRLGQMESGRAAIGTENGKHVEIGDGEQLNAAVTHKD
ncbi:hypothetical protein [Methylobacterium sp. E-066]|uniref:hypothetical protein n=1 Tax=Methylobacterium sp. E-066 TaxID=2836584 RepID=UPI001FB9456F|nr:hypothetical protein [Methylobacterium sp. E-066]MCJ2138667.1 hypothetical protein [Methylobacterium sp. E-066]